MRLLGIEVNFWRRTEIKKKGENQDSENYINYQCPHNTIKVIEGRLLRWSGHMKRVGSDKIPNNSIGG